MTPREKLAAAVRPHAPGGKLLSQHIPAFDAFADALGLPKGEALASGPLVVNDRGIKLLHHFEQCRLEAYLDAVKVPTIGWGSTYYPSGERVKMGDRITQAQADDMFARILERDFAGPIRALLNGVPTNADQFSAMTALAYNIGFKGFRESSVLRRHRDGGDVTAAFAMWQKAGGKVLNGLVRRRAAEAALYRGDYAALRTHTQGAVS